MTNLVIKKNKHASTLFGFLPHIKFSFKNEFTFTGSFDENCLYNFDTVDKWDINKLIGLSTSYHHHKQSVRFGWRCLNGKTIEILAYCYDKGKRLEKFIDHILCEVEPGQEFKLRIKIYPNKFKLTALSNDKCSSVVLLKQGGWKFKYFLFPFFGGNLKAPHDMNIYLKIE